LEMMFSTRESRGVETTEANFIIERVDSSSIFSRTTVPDGISPPPLIRRTLLCSRAGDRPESTEQSIASRTKSAEMITILFNAISLQKKFGCEVRSHENGTIYLKKRRPLRPGAIICEIARFRTRLIMPPVPFSSAPSQNCKPVRSYRPVWTPPRPSQRPSSPIENPNRVRIHSKLDGPTVTPSHPSQRTVGGTARPPTPSRRRRTTEQLRLGLGDGRARPMRLGDDRAVRPATGHACRRCRPVGCPSLKAAATGSRPRPPAGH
jgi:hypothetical protein